MFNAKSQCQSACEYCCLCVCCHGLEFAVHELLLPDAAMVHGRFIVSAWEFGLDGIQDDAAKLLSLAVEVRPNDSLWSISPNVCRLLKIKCNVFCSLK